VTDEQEGKVTPYIEKNGIEYTIALGGASGYKTRGIPAAWLVGPDGKVLWKGHPSGLNASIIEEHLAKVRMTPQWDKLPGGLKNARKALGKGLFAKGLKALAKEVDDADHGAAASEAIEQVKAYGQSQLDMVDSHAEAGNYSGGMELLGSLEKSFKGTEIGDAAKAKRSEWKKDKTVKAELEGEKLLAKAQALLRDNPKGAASVLLKITKGKKYEGTKARAAAEAKLSGLEAHF
jgi:hypothetical protein